MDRTRSHCLCRGFARRLNVDGVSRAPRFLAVRRLWQRPIRSPLIRERESPRDDLDEWSQLDDGLWAGWCVDQSDLRRRALRRGQFDRPDHHLKGRSALDADVATRPIRLHLSRLWKRTLRRGRQYLGLHGGFDHWPQLALVLG